MDREEPTDRRSPSSHGPSAEEETPAAREPLELSRWPGLKSDGLRLAVDPDLPPIHSLSSPALPSALFKALMAERKEIRVPSPPGSPDKERRTERNQSLSQQCLKSRIHRAWQVSFLPESSFP